jgi:hypothetical protein
MAFDAFGEDHGARGASDYGVFEKNHENIRAAIYYRRRFPADEPCSEECVYFMDGKKSDEAYPPFWSEVKYLSYLNMKLFCLTGLLNRAMIK